MSCDVCDKEPEVGFASSTFGPCSFGYCKTCLSAGAEPYWICVATAAQCGTLGLATWARRRINASLKVAGKTREEFEADVAKEAAEYEAHCARVDADVAESGE